MYTRGRVHPVRTSSSAITSIPQSQTADSVGLSFSGPTSIFPTHGLTASPAYRVNRSVRVKNGDVCCKNLYRCVCLIGIYGPWGLVGAAVARQHGALHYRVGHWPRDCETSTVNFNSASRNRQWNCIDSFSYLVSVYLHCLSLSSLL